MPPRNAARQLPEFSQISGNGLDRIEALKRKRLQDEEAKKSAGIWGEVSVGLIERGDDAFVMTWKGQQQTDLFKLAAKKPKEITTPDHEALKAWLKAGRYEGFKSIISAWNVSADEAERLKLELITGLPGKGMRAVNG